MSKRRYGKRNARNKAPLLLFLGFSLIGIWLVASIIKGVNPLKLFTLKSDVADTEEVRISYDSLETLYQIEKEKVSTFSKEIAAYQASAAVRTVSISSGTLNMRAAASTSAEIIGDISTGTEVKVYYCKLDSTIIDGSKGTWCKISNANTEGWVWSAYLQ